MSLCQLEPAMAGGTAARFPELHPHRLAQPQWYFAQQPAAGQLPVEDGALWRDAYTVLDRVPDTAPQQVRLLEGVRCWNWYFWAR